MYGHGPEVARLLEEWKKEAWTEIEEDMSLAEKEVVENL